MHNNQHYFLNCSKGKLSIFKFLYHLSPKLPSDTICYINAEALGEDQI